MVYSNTIRASQLYELRKGSVKSRFRLEHVADADKWRKIMN